MAKYETLPVFKETYDLVLNIYKTTSHFSNDLKHSLGEGLKRDSLMLIREIYRVNKSKDKSLHFDDFLDCFELVKMELRLCFDMKAITAKKHAELSLLMDGIGKQINGWKKYHISKNNVPELSLPR